MIVKYDTVRGPQKYSLGLCFIPRITSSLIWSQIASTAWKGLSLVPHVTPAWGDVVGPSCWAYVGAPQCEIRGPPLRNKIHGGSRF